jgi:DNA modification methylase
MGANIIHGDVVEVLRGYEANTFDAILCDPPYGLSFMGKRWDYDVPSVELWAEVLRVCKPGAPLLAAFGTRTYHRGVVRIEDAGFEIRDCIAWMHGEGFPKNRQTQLKPAHEPYVLARKPLDGTVAENVARWGVGALAIDACRIGTGEDKGVWPVTDRATERGSMSGPMRAAETDATVGRWPANVILDEEAGAALDAQTSDLKGGRYTGKRTQPKTKNAYGAFDVRDEEPVGYGDSGGASRFFYCAKASTRERGKMNKHPTVKPLALCEYLARLIMPPKPGKLLVPFSGSGSEVIGAMRAGWSDVVGIERESEYVQTAKIRIITAGFGVDS